MKIKVWIQTGLAVTAGVVVLMTSGCASIKRERDILPQELVAEARIPGIPYARYWGDVPPEQLDEWLNASPEELRKAYGGIIGKTHTYLAISGGGANGAYGAGILKGWTDSGKRPEFTLVTGISTGAIIAPFAFLGPAYDHVLIDLYTTKSTKDVVFSYGLLKGIRSDAFTDSYPLRNLLLSYIGEAEVEQIAVEFRKGRRLFVSTVNMDSLRPVTWSIGEIAASGQPGSRELIVDVILASTSIPIAFPPVFIDVEADGKIYQEMHVDGGLASQVFVYPPSVKWKEIEDRLAPSKPTTVYVIRNAKIDPVWTPTEAKITPLAMRTISSLIRTQGVGDLDKIALTTLRDGLGFGLTYIPAEFNEKATETFDPVYMSKLFDFGYQRMMDGNAWKSRVDLAYEHEKVVP
jgi:predicted patatin/cPLA2 family phospholipase